MHETFFALALTILAAGPAAASDAMAPVHQFVHSLNMGDATTAAAACAHEASIIDEFAPYEWHGAGACATWINDFVVHAQAEGITDSLVTLGTPRHVDVTADRAYVVIPAIYAYKKNGKLVREAGCTLTAALQEVNGQWRIAAWSWSKR